MLTHKPDVVSVEDWWISTLQIHHDFTILAIESEKWRSLLEGEAHEPRQVFQAVMRLGLISMALTEYYRSRVGVDWFEEVGCNTSLLPPLYTLRHLAENGLLPGYSEPESPHEGSGADA